MFAAADAEVAGRTVSSRSEDCRRRTRGLYAAGQAFPSANVLRQTLGTSPVRGGRCAQPGTTGRRSCALAIGTRVPYLFWRNLRVVKVLPSAVDV